MVSIYLPEASDDPQQRENFAAYGVAKPTDIFSATLEDTLYYNPFSALTRSITLAEAKAQGRLLSKDEWSASNYFREGMVYPEKGLSEPAAKILAERYDERETRKAILTRGPGGFGMGAAKFGTALFGSLFDPLNVASVFVPGAAIRSFVAARRAVKLGEQLSKKRIIQENLFQGGKTRERLGLGALEGAIGIAPLEVPILLAAEMEQDKDYTILDSFLNVTIGSALGGGLHAVGGLMADRLRRMRPETKEMAINSAIAQKTSGRPVDVEDIVNRDKSYEQKKYDPKYHEPMVVNYADEKSVTARLEDIERLNDPKIRRKGKTLPPMLNPIYRLNNNKKPLHLYDWLKQKKVSAYSTDLPELERFGKQVSKEVVTKQDRNAKGNLVQTLDNVIRDAVDEGYYFEEPSLKTFIDDLDDTISGRREVYRMQDEEIVLKIRQAEEYKEIAATYGIDPKGMTDDEFMRVINNNVEANARHEEIINREYQDRSYNDIDAEDYDAIMTRQMESLELYKKEFMDDDFEEIFAVPEPTLRDVEMSDLDIEIQDLETNIQFLRDNDLLAEDADELIKNADDGIERVDTSFREAALAGAKCIMRST